MELSQGTHERKENSEKKNGVSAKLKEVAVYNITTNLFLSYFNLLSLSCYYYFSVPECFPRMLVTKTALLNNELTS